MTESVKATLARAFRYLLKPLVRLSIRNGLSFPEFSQALKAAYVDVASKGKDGTGFDATDERIAAMTGVSVKEIREVLNEDVRPGAISAEGHSQPLAVLLSAWHTDARFLGPYGVLLDLPLSVPFNTKGTPTFSDLVQRHCPGLDPRMALEELVVAGCVQKVGERYYRAIKRSYVHVALSEKSIMYMARTVHNLCESLEMNQRAESSGDKGLMQRSIYTVHGLTREDLTKFNEYLRTRGQSFADDIDNWLTERDLEGISDVVKTGVGFYHYIITDDEEMVSLKQSTN
jgi:Family of unknown function (DUF6502)